MVVIMVVVMCVCGSDDGSVLGIWMMTLMVVAVVVVMMVRC